MNKELYELDRLFKENKFNKVIKIAKTLINSETSIAPYYNLLGLSLSQLGKNKEAEKYFLEGIEKFSQEISLKSNISTIQLNLNKVEEAEKNIYDALKINGEDIYTLFALGKLKRVQNKFLDAVEVLKKVCEKNVKFPKAVMLLGQTYLDLAHQNNENKYYDLAKKNLLLYSQLFPLVTSVDYILSTLIDYSLNDFHQKKMLKKLEKFNFDESEKTFIYFALAKSFEDQKKYDQSAHFIKLANDLRNQRVDKNIIKNEKLKKKNIKYIFDSTKFINPNKESLFQKKMIFIVGLPRSGTTLVHQILSSVDDVYGFGESIFLNNFFEKNIFNKSFISSFLNKKHMEDEIIKVSNEIGNKYNSFSSKKIFIDKMPPNFYWIGFIKLIFPNARVIHISRDIKDNCISIYKNLFGAKDMDWSYDSQNIIKFILNYKDLMKYWKTKYPSFIYDIKYENLVENKIKETKSLFNYCDIPWSEEVFDFYKKARTIRTVSINQVKKPIYTSSVKSSQNYSKHIEFLNNLEKL